MKAILALTALATAIAASPALAQSSAPGGIYVGALGGYEGFDVESADGSVTADADSAVYGIAAGYDLALGSAFVGVEGERVDRASRLRTRGVAVGEREGLELEGDGDVQATPAVGAEAGDGLDEAVRRCQQRLIAQVLPGLLGEGRVDLRRLAVGDRVADDGVVVHGGSRGQ